MYATSVETAAPTIPHSGTSQKLSATFTNAPAPVTTQLSCVLRARPLPIASTVKPAYTAPENASSATPSCARWKAGAVRSWTSHGASAPSASAAHDVSVSRYVSTNAYVRLASRSSSIEYANAGQAVRNATRMNVITAAIFTAAE